MGIETLAERRAAIHNAPVVSTFVVDDFCLRSSALLRVVYASFEKEIADQSARTYIAITPPVLREVLQIRLSEYWQMFTDGGPTTSSGTPLSICHAFSRATCNADNELLMNYADVWFSSLVVGAHKAFKRVRVISGPTDELIPIVCILCGTPSYPPKGVFYCSGCGAPFGGGETEARQMPTCNTK